MDNNTPTKSELVSNCKINVNERDEEQPTTCDVSVEWSSFFFFEFKIT